MPRATLTPFPEPLRRLRAWVLRRVAGEGGFILLESIIAISLITVIMGAVGAEYVAGLSSASHQRAEKTAVQLADTAMEQIRALHASDLLTGRDQNSVIAERNTLTAYPTVANAVSSDATKIAYDSTVTSGGASAAVPTCIVATGGLCGPTPALIQQPGTTPFTVYKYLECNSASNQGSCLSSASTINYVRAIVAVTWTQRGCPSSQCAYTTSALINADADPQFNNNQPLPPAPQIAPIAAQSIEIGDAVSLQLLVKDGTGVAPFFWSTTPAGLATLSALGLAISPGGLISGTVAAGAVSGTTQIILTDSFGARTDTATITWTVYPKLVFTTVADQLNAAGATVNLTVTASGGKSGYTFSDPNGTLPAGLAISAAGRITGTLTTVGPNTVQLLVTDSSSPAHTARSNSFNWTVSNPPIGANPGTQTSTRNKAISTLTLSASGGSAPYTWSSSGLPTGLTRTSNTIAGTPTATGSYGVTITVTDAAGNTNTQTFTWNVVASPTVTAPAAQATTVGGTANATFSYTCPNTPCAFRLNSGPANLTVGAGTITGTVGGPAATYTATVTITDAAAVSVTSASFTWTVNPVPTITSPGDQTTPRSTAVSLNMSAQVSGGTGSFTYALVGSALPSGLSLNPATGRISGTTGATNTNTTNIMVRVTDASGFSATTAGFAWHVSNLTLNVPDYPFNFRGGSLTISLSAVTTGGTSPYGPYSASGLPPGLSLSGSTISGTLPSYSGSWTVTLTVTDAAGALDYDTTTITAF